MPDVTKIASMVRRFRYPYRAIQEFDGVPWADSINYFVAGDINEDHQIELILSRGDVEQIALDLNGQILWHVVDPSASWQTRRPDSSVFIWDLDLDGHPELVCTRRLGNQEHLCLLDAATGELKQAVLLTSRAEHSCTRGFARLGLFDGPAHPGCVVAGWDYDRLALYDSDLHLVWEQTTPIGHDPFCVDINEDGQEEIVCGYTAFDREGRQLWDSRQYLKHDSHADSFEFFIEDGAVRIFTSEGHILDGAGARVDDLGKDFVVHGQETGILSTRGEQRFVIQDRGDGLLQTTYIVTRQGKVMFMTTGAQTIQPVVWGKQEESGIWLDTHGIIYDGNGGLMAKLRAYERGCWRLPTSGVGSAHDLMHDGRDELLLRHFDEDTRTAWCEIYSADPQPSQPTPKTTTRQMADWSFY